MLITLLAQESVRESSYALWMHPGRHDHTKADEAYSRAYEAYRAACRVLEACDPDGAAAFIRDSWDGRIPA